MSRQTLTHCGKYLDQNQEADFHLELAQSAKQKSENEKKREENKIQYKKRPLLNLPESKIFQSRTEQLAKGLDRTSL